MNNSTHSSTYRLGNTDEQYLNSKAAANNQNILHRNQKWIWDFYEDGNRAPFMDVSHRSKRKLICLVSRPNTDTDPQADPCDKGLQPQGTSYHAESLSQFSVG